MEILIRYTSISQGVVSLINYVEMLEEKEKERVQGIDLIELKKLIAWNTFRVYKFLFKDSPSLTQKKRRVKLCELERELTAIENVIARCYSLLGTTK